MCGIAGAVTADGGAPDRVRLERMADALAHRGPDGSGLHVSGAVGLAHRRLAIIDLETGDQPLFAGAPGEEPLALVANGEVYNYRELAAEMPDACLRTGSDCEPPLHLYRREGIAGFDRLRGMYAIALADPHACPGGRLVLVRDPFGIKPLYYVEGEDGFAFASEPAALIAGGYATAAVEDKAVAEILQLQFTTGEATPFRAIRRVAPGETLVVEGGRIVARRQRPALPAPTTAPKPPAGRSWDDALDAFDRLFEETVDLHQRSDVPYGMFFSGGIDSTALLIMMARLNDRPVHAFTAGFPGTRVHDERAHARMIADRLGARTTDVTLGEDDFMRLLPRVAAALDDPVADYAVLPTFRLAEVAGSDFKVILSGEGGDELFGGYGRYRRAMRPRLLGGRPMRRKGAFDGLDVLRKEIGGWRDGIAAAEIEARARGGSRLQQMQAVDCRDWLANDLLIKLDRCLMANGIEGRTPFLDPALAAFAYPLPDRFKVDRKLGKLLVRKWIERELPEARPFAPKRGFTVPIGEWIGARGEVLGPLVAASPLVERWCRPEAVRALFAGASDGGRPAHAAWTLLLLALWHRHHVLGRGPANDAVEALRDI